MSWRWLAGVSSCFPLLSSIFLAFIPESPSWLVTQGRLEQARASLTWLRGNNYDIEEEFAKLKESYTKTQTKDSAESVNLAQKGKHLARQLSRPDVFKPLLLVDFLLLTTTIPLLDVLSMVSPYRRIILAAGSEK